MFVVFLNARNETRKLNRINAKRENFSSRYFKVYHRAGLKHLNLPITLVKFITNVAAICRNKVRGLLYIQNFDTFRDRVIQLARGSALKMGTVIGPL